jgi:hypothetical protein
MGEWGNGPICKETGEEFAITFGHNNFVYCGQGCACIKALTFTKQFFALQR